LHHPRLLCGFVALFFFPAFVRFDDVPAPLWNCGPAPLRRPELPPPIDSEPL
jgi:hypothetical protein